MSVNFSRMMYVCVYAHVYAYACKNVFSLDIFDILTFLSLNTLIFKHLTDLQKFVTACCNFCKSNFCKSVVIHCFGVPSWLISRFPNSCTLDMIKTLSGNRFCHTICSCRMCALLSLLNSTMINSPLGESSEVSGIPLQPSGTFFHITHPRARAIRLHSLSI